jgi:hypothetical protein
MDIEIIGGTPAFQEAVKAKMMSKGIKAEVIKTEKQAPAWYVSTTGNHQGLIIDETTGANIAVSYDAKHAPLIAAAPDLLAVCQELVTQEEMGLHPAATALACLARVIIAKATQH